MLVTGVDAAAIVSAAGFVGIAGFQFALALGAPWGRAAWGGRSEGRLQLKLRVASLVAGTLWLLATPIVLGRAGVMTLGLPEGILRWGSWTLAVLLGVGTLMNLASRSRTERLIWTPISGVLALSTFLVARSPWPPT